MSRLRSKNKSEWVCGECGAEVEVTPVYHCPGHSQAFGAKYKGEPHHHTSLHGHCPSCNADLGCFKCSGPYRDLLCMNCKTFIDGTKPIPREEAAGRLNAMVAGLMKRVWR